MAKYIKNEDNVVHTWCGTPIEPGEYYMIPDQDKLKWANDSQLIIDIASGYAAVAKTDDETTDFTDVSEAINYLKDIINQLTNVDGYPLVAPTFEDAQGLTTVWKGRIYTATAGAVNIFDEPVTTQIKVRGGWYELMNDKAVAGDYVEFSIVDKDNILGLFGLYGLTVGVDVLELKKFIRTEYINPLRVGSKEVFESAGASTVYAGLYMRVTYHSTGVDDVDFKVVEKYHEI